MLSCLNDDVTRNILSFCDLSSVLTFSQTNKYSRELAFTSREVWFPFASELCARGYIDLAPGHTLYNRTVQELVFLIKRVGFFSGTSCYTQTALNRPSSLSSKQITFSLLDPHVPESRPPRQVISVSGGKYVLIRYQDQMRLEAWSIWDGILVWSSENYPLSMAEWDRVDSVEARLDDDVLVMSIWLRRQLVFPPPNNIHVGYALKLLELDLKAGSSKITTLLNFTSSVDFSHCLPLRLEGDYAVGYGSNQLTIYRRSRGLKMYFCHREDAERISDVHIFQNYLIFGQVLSDETGPVGFQALAWDLAAVEDRWRSHNKDEVPLYIEDVKSIYSLFFDIPAGSTVHYCQLQCNPSPLHPDCCQLYVLRTLEDGVSYDVENYALTCGGSESQTFSIRRAGSFGPFPLERGVFPCNFASSLYCSCWPEKSHQLNRNDGEMESASSSRPYFTTLYGRSAVHLERNVMTVTYYS